MNWMSQLLRQKRKQQALNNAETELAQGAKSRQTVNEVIREIRAQAERDVADARREIIELNQ